MGNVAHHLKSLPICPKWMDEIFHGCGCPYLGRLVQFSSLSQGNSGPNPGVPVGSYAEAAASKGQGDTPQPLGILCMHPPVMVEGL